MSEKIKPIATRATVNVPALRQPEIQHERISTCPETGIDLNTVDILKHCKNLWPALDEREPAYAEARRRRDHLLHEYTARETERGMHTLQY